MRFPLASLCLAALLPAFSAAIHAQAPLPAPHFTSLPPIAFSADGPVIRAHTETLKPFTVAGERGVLLGQQDGAFEAWVLPVKLVSNMTIEAGIEGYTVPIDVNQQSAEIEVRPDRTVITYSHIGFTVRQIMFSPQDAPAGTGPVVLYQFDCVHPTDFTFRFTPNLEHMWPERNEGHPEPEWVAHGPNAFEQAGGYYVLHADYPDLAGAITIPGARPGILAPYQERPQVHPVELKLHIDPAKDAGKLYPLLMAVGTDTASANTRALGDTLEKLNQSIGATYAAHAEAYRKLLANSVSIETPDKALNEAFQWAVVSIEQLKAKPVCGGAPSGRQPSTSSSGSEGTVSGHDFSRAETSAKENGALAPAPPPATCPDETALVAGYYASGDSARPGFGWFFGRDALYTLYAVNGYGDFALSKSELEFLIHRQRADGKIMHEYSQTASKIDWQQFPYMYAAADSTPLFLMAILDYVRASGDTDFLNTHKDAVEKAWQFETDPAHDTDHDGIYDNSQGTGWVESWPGGMPHQEIYLAVLDEQASQAYAELQKLVGNDAAATAANKRAETIAATIEKEYYDPQKGCYAFATNPAGTPNSPVDRTTTMYPALAWWSSWSKQPLAHGDDCLKQFAAHTLNTDWGLRDVSNEEKIYDGMSYHQGSVWPLFTGWAAMAEYRGGQPLAGYQMLKENANLTWAQDLGAVTELLSGDFFVPFGRSTSHQLWSSAMVITPTLRGLFGISIDAQTKTITVNPHLPASWKNAKVEHIHVGNVETTVYISRIGDHLDLALDHFGSKDLKIRSDMPGAKPSRDVNGDVTVHVPLPALEVDADLSRERNAEVAAAVLAWHEAPSPGSRTQRFRVVQENYSDHKLVLNVEGAAGSSGALNLVRHAMLVPHPQFQLVGSSGTRTDLGGISMIDTALHDPNEPIALFLNFPPGEGWKTITVTLTW